MATTRVVRLGRRVLLLVVLPYCLVVVVGAVVVVLGWLKRVLKTSPNQRTKLRLRCCLGTKKVTPYLLAGTTKTLRGSRKSGCNSGDVQLERYVIRNCQNTDQ